MCVLRAFMRLKGTADWVMVTLRTGLYPAARELRYTRLRSLPGMVVSSCSTYRGGGGEEGNIPLLSVRGVPNIIREILLLYIYVHTHT